EGGTGQGDSRGGTSAAPERPAPLSLQVGTNGVISTQDFPRETQYVDDDFPTDFPVIAPFLADLDTSGDRGNIYYRQDVSQDVLDQAVGYIQAGFPRSAGAFVPTNAFIATWEDVGAYQELSQDTQPSTKLNTFQAVIAYNDEDTYTIFLYPSGGLQFLGTRPKESYNVQLELPARVGFSWGDGDDPKRDGLFHSLASSEQALRSLERESNTGIPGVWVFHVGSAEQVEPGGGEGAAAAVPHPNPGTASYPHPPSSHTPTAQRPSHGPHSPVLLGFVPGGRRDAQERSPWDSDTRQSHSASPSSYSSGHHGVGVEEDVHFNPDGEQPQPLPSCSCKTGQPSPACRACQGKRQAWGMGWGGMLRGQVTIGLATLPAPEPAVEPPWHVPGGAEPRPQPTASQKYPQESDLSALWTVVSSTSLQMVPIPFSCPGAEFTQSLEVTFYPGGETVQVTQTAEGLGPDNYLNLRTHIQGEVPFLPENVTVHITPYKELYSYSSSAVTSSGQREYVVVAGTANQTLSYRLRQNVTVSGCAHARPPARQQLSVARAFALFDGHEHVLRYALAARVGPAPDDAENPVVSPCHDGSHGCEAPARCQPGAGTEYSCECTAGYRREGRGCRDVDECAEGLSQCGPFSVCLNVPGSFRCECRGGYRLAGDGQACVPLTDPCEAGQHRCAPGRARCLSRGDGRATCECLPGYSGDGIHCSDVDECAESPCHPAAVCYNTPGSFSCRCRPGYAGDGFQCTHAVEGNPQRLTPCQHAQMYPREVPPLGDGHVPQCDEQGRYRPLQCHGSSGHCWCVDAAGQEIAGTRTAPGTTPPRCGSPEPTERPPSMCERWRQSLLEHYGGSPRGDQYVPQCEPGGDFAPLQCHGDSGYCWCVEQSGREIPGTRSEPGTTPPCLPSVAPPSVRPQPRPDVSPPASGTFLLYAQGQQIGYLPLNGTRLHKEAAKTLLSLH
ncbi:NID2 protein, partial [Cercotrichas coryphoeus]|nr:NID2 protein [Cercotrichas coryphoeus]